MDRKKHRLPAKKPSLPYRHCWDSQGPTRGGLLLLQTSNASFESSVRREAGEVGEALLLLSPSRSNSTAENLANIARDVHEDTDLAGSLLSFSQESQFSRFSHLADES